MPFTYRLFDRTGEDLGTIEYAVSNLRPGETIHGYAGMKFRIVDVVPFEGDNELVALLKVEPAADAEQPWRQ